MFHQSFIGQTIYFNYVFDVDTDLRILVLDFMSSFSFSFSLSEDFLSFWTTDNSKKDCEALIEPEEATVCILGLEDPTGVVGFFGGVLFGSEFI